MTNKKLKGRESGPAVIAQTATEEGLGDTLFASPAGFDSGHDAGARFRSQFTLFPRFTTYRRFTIIVDFGNHLGWAARLASWNRARFERRFWTGLAAAADRSAFTSENCLIFSLELINLIFDGSGAAEGVGRDGYIHEILLISRN